MSFLGKMFDGKKKSKNKKSPSLTTGEAIQKLRETEEMLIKKQDFLEKKIEQEIETAKKNASKNKRAAIQALKRKKRYEQQLQQIDGTLSTIEMQREALDGAHTNTAVLQTMKNTAKALKNVHVDVDQVRDMMDDISEQQDLAREISDAISNPISFGQDIDEDELERELEELEQEELDKELLKVGPSQRLPSVPIAEPKINKPSRAKTEQEDDYMKELEKWAS